MPNNNNSNQMLVPQAQAAMNKFKMESAAEVGVTIKEGYNGDLTSRQAGSVGGQMVKKMCPERTMKFEREYRWVDGHSKSFTYEFGFGV